VKNGGRNRGVFIVLKLFSRVTLLCAGKYGQPDGIDTSLSRSIVSFVREVFKFMIDLCFTLIIDNWN